MRRSMRTFFVCLLVALVIYQPAAACNSCGDWGGGSYAPVYYYGPVAYDGGCCGGGYETAVYDSCDACGSCNSCGEHEGVVVNSAPAEQIPTPAATTPKAPTIVSPVI